MTAEQFECLIPTPDAFKESVLYCSTNATNAVDIWVAFGTVGSAVAAVGLAIWSVIDSRRSHRRADAALQREQYTARQEKLIKVSEPVKSVLQEMRSVDEALIAEQSSELYWAVDTFRDHVSRLGAVESEFGKYLLTLAGQLNYAINDMLAPDGFGRSHKLGYQWTRGVGGMNMIIGRAITDLIYAVTEQEKYVCLESLKAKGERWLHNYFLDGDYGNFGDRP
ncbi:hypothetical protein [Glutamicibacter sp.]|uniref:hypothetical protein n=1 Tax=Glutamicibacter sp. TaxID=1931995 RepID=UPI003D6B32C2